jgi:hypothetical protein
MDVVKWLLALGGQAGCPGQKLPGGQLIWISRTRQGQTNPEA